MFGAAPANVAITLELRGPNVSNGNGCAARAMANGEAFHRLQRGDLDVVLAAGADAQLAPLTFSSFAIIKAMSTANQNPATPSRPFDAAHYGFVMGEVRRCWF